MSPRPERIRARFDFVSSLAARTRGLPIAVMLALSAASVGADPTAEPGGALPLPGLDSGGLLDDPNAILLAQAINPATSGTAMGPQAAGEQTGVPSQRLRSWEQPAIVVEGSRLSPFREDELIGSYMQPRWTAHRRFAGTRVFVRPEGQVDFEQWFRWENSKDGPDTLVTQSEIEFGLPRRFQLDLYLITRNTDGEPTKVDSAIEVRYALADWGRIWGNPTLYVEWKSQDQDPDVVETKLLLGGDIGPGWHWGTNLVWEQSTGGTRESVYELTGGLSQTLLDMKFSWGLETKLEWADEAGSRGDYTNDMRLGPSFQWRPMPQMHVDFAPLFGLTSESSRSDVYLIFGYEF